MEKNKRGNINLFRVNKLMNRHNNLKLSIILLFIFIFSCTFKVQALDNIQFQRITVEDGLSQSTINAIIQDSKCYYTR